MEIQAITAALSGIKNAIDIAKLIRDSGTSLQAAEANLKLAELLEALSAAKIEIANVNEVVLEQQSEIRRLNAQIEKQSKMVWEDPYYFALTENGERDGPYCQKCYDSSKKLIRLQSPNKNGYWQCNECKSHYTDSTYKGTEYAVRIPRKSSIDLSGY